LARKTPPPPPPHETSALIVEEFVPTGLGGAGLIRYPGSTSPFAWDRLEKEPRADFNLFTLFLELGPTRSFDRLARMTGREETELRSTAMKWRWAERLTRFEEYFASVMSNFTKEMIRGSRQEGVKLLTIAMNHTVAQLLAKMSDPTDNPDTTELLKRLRIIYGALGSETKLKETGERKPNKSLHFHFGLKDAPAVPTLEAEAILLDLPNGDEP